MNDIHDPRLTDADEARLRAVLAEHAPDTIDTNRAYTAFASRLATSQAASSIPAATQSPKTRRSVLKLRWRTLAPIAAVLALAVLLMGAGYMLWAGPFAGGELQLIGQKHLYTAINQRQTASGLTITVTNVYADEGRTLIAYTIDPSASVRAHYDHVVLASWTFTDQTGHEPAGATTQCTEMPTDGGPIYCLMDTPSFAASGDTLNITWDISKAYLLNSASTTTDTATWHFAFSMPYLHVNNGQGAYPQLCSALHGACTGPATTK